MGEDRSWHPFPKNILGKERQGEEGRAAHLQLGDDLLLGDFHQLAVLHSKGRVGDDGEHAGVHLLGRGGPWQHRVEDGLGEGEGEGLSCRRSCHKPSGSPSAPQRWDTGRDLTWQCCTSSDSTRITDCGPPFAPKRSSSSRASRAACKQGDTRSSVRSTMLPVCKSSHPAPAPLPNLDQG